MGNHFRCNNTAIVQHLMTYNPRKKKSICIMNYNNIQAILPSTKKSKKIKAQNEPLIVASSKWCEVGFNMREKERKPLSFSSFPLCLCIADCSHVSSLLGHAFVSILQPASSRCSLTLNMPSDNVFILQNYFDVRNID